MDVITLDKKEITQKWEETTTDESKSKSTDKRQEAPGAQVSAEREVASPTGAVLNSQRY